MVAPSARCLVFSVGVAFALGLGCTAKENFLGYDRRVSVDPGVTQTTPEPQPSTPGSVAVDSGLQPSPEPSGSSATGDGVEAGATSSDDDDTVSEPQAPIEAGSQPPPTTGEPVEAGEPPEELTPLVPRVDLPNVFVEELGVTESEVTQRVNSAFEQLFHGDPDVESIYFEISDEEAYIYDVLHDDTRIDALGYGLMICVLLDRKSEFDRIWTYTKRRFQYDSGPQAGYFRGKCKTTGDCEDSVPFGPFGSFHVTTALLFAEGRWGNGAAHLDYGAEAREQLSTYLGKESQNGGVVDGVTNMFDATTLLPQAVPTEQSRGETTTGSVMPAFFEVWGERTQNATWTRAAAVGRELLARAIHPTTGLSPLRVGPDGQALEGANIFNESGYSVGFNLALDYAWYEHDARQVDAANLLVDFFAAFPTRAYPALFSADGEALSEQTSEALVAMNGSAAAIATSNSRTRLIRDVWETPTPVSVYRFYDGVNLLFSLIYLSGGFHVH